MKWTVKELVASVFEGFAKAEKERESALLQCTAVVDVLDIDDLRAFHATVNSERLRITQAVSCGGSNVFFVLTRETPLT